MSLSCFFLQASASQGHSGTAIGEAQKCSWLTARRNNRIVSQNRPSPGEGGACNSLTPCPVESSRRCFPVRIPSAWMIGLREKLLESQPASWSCCDQAKERLSCVANPSGGGGVSSIIQPQGVVPEQIELQLF